MQTELVVPPRTCTLVLALVAGCAAPDFYARQAARNEARLESYNEHLRQHPDDLAVRHDRAVAILKGDFDSDAKIAQADLEAWIAAHPDDADAHGWLAEAFRMQGDPERRAAVLARHAELQPTEWKPDWMRAMRCLATRRWNAARAALTAALAATDPDSRAAADARFWRGFAALRGGDAKAAATDLAAWKASRASDLHHGELVLEARCAAGDYDAYVEAGRLGWAYGIALAQLAHNDPERARQHLDRILEHHPDDVRAYRLRAACWFAEGVDSRGLEDLAKALAIDPNDVDARQERVAARMRLRAWDGARDDQAAIVVARPDEAEGFLLLARIELARDRLDPALEAVAKACDLGADVPEVHSLRATAFERQGDYAAAVQNHHRYLERKPDDADARLLAARCSFRLDRFDAARADCELVLAQAAGRADARALRALCLAGLGDVEFAVAELDQLVQRPDPALLTFLQQRLRESTATAVQPVRSWLAPYETALPHLVRADALHRDGRHAEALVEIDALLAAAPRVAQGHLLRGMILHDLQRPDDALAAVERYGEAFPDCPLYHRDRGICLVSLKRLDDAELAFQRSAELDEQDPHLWNAYGVCLVRKGDVEGAWWVFGRALKIAEHEEGILQNRIETSELLGKHEAAGTAWSALAAVRRGDHLVNFRAGQAWQRAGDYDLAMRHYDAAKGLMLASAELARDYGAPLYWNRAVCEIQLKKFREAQYDFERALQYDPQLPRLDFTDYDRLRAEQEAAWRAHLAQLAAEQAEAKQRAQQRAASDFGTLSPPVYYRIWDDSSWDNLQYGAYLERRIRARLDGKDPDLVPRHLPK